MGAMRPSTSCNSSASFRRSSPCSMASSSVEWASAASARAVQVVRAHTVWVQIKGDGQQARLDGFVPLPGAESFDAHVNAFGWLDVDAGKDLGRLNGQRGGEAKQRVDARNAVAALEEANLPFGGAPSGRRAPPRSCRCASDTRGACGRSSTLLG